MKHSITKRCTHGRCWEVRLNSVAGPRRVQAGFAVLSALVERGLGEGDDKERALTRSWLKIYGVAPGIRSVDRRTPTRSPTAPARPRTGPAVPAATSTALFAVQLRGTAFGLAQKHPARRGDRGEPQGGSGGTRRGDSVPDENERHQDTAERRPADHVARPVATHGWRVMGVRGRASVRLGGAGRCRDAPGRGPVRGRGMVRGGRSGHGVLPVSGVREFNAWHRPRSLDPPPTGPQGAQTACTGQQPLPYGRGLVHAPLNAAERRYVQVPQRAGVWAEEECRRTLGGMGLGR